MTGRRGGAIAALLRDYAHGRRRTLALLALVTIAAALSEAVGLVALVPLIAAIGSPDLAVPFLPPSWLAATAARRLGLAVGLFLGAMAARTLLALARDRLAARIAESHSASLRLRAVRRLGEIGWPRASTIGQGGFQALLLADIPRAVLAASQAQALLVALVMLVAQGAVAFALSPGLTLVAALLLFGSVAVTAPWLRASHRRGAAFGEALGDSAALGERLHGALKSALAQDQLGAFIADYRRGLDRLGTHDIALQTSQAAARAAGLMAAALGAVVLAVTGSLVFGLPGGTLAMAMILFARMAGPAQGAQQSLQGMIANAPAFAAIEARLGPLARGRNLPPDEPVVPLDWSRVEGRDICPRHADGPPLRPVDLTLSRGEWVGVSGPSGAGKTSLLDAVAGLVPATGVWSRDGCAFDPHGDRCWAASLSYVGQQDLLFAGTIRDNLRAGGVAASEAELAKVAALTGLDRLRDGEEGGLETAVGERAVSLSGGERQRVALARALLRRPRLLILDEATAALDLEAERAVLTAIRRDRPDLAVLLVAHRPETLGLCDRVVPLDSVYFAR